MSIGGTTNITSGPNMGVTTHPTQTAYNTSSSTYDIVVGKAKGSSYFVYYVNGQYAHSSTDWFNFDFT
jgi:hypothetical protein